MYRAAMWLVTISSVVAVCSPTVHATPFIAHSSGGSGGSVESFISFGRRSIRVHQTFYPVSGASYVDSCERMGWISPETRPMAVSKAWINRFASDMVVDFPYHDRVLLRWGHSNGGRIWVPAEAMGVDRKVPIIVLLHGIETGRHARMHRFLQVTQNMPAVAKELIAKRHIEPFILAAPSQTAHSGWSKTLWTKEGFDLAEFVVTVQRVLGRCGAGIRVDKSRVSVFGHSGAGCGNGQNGLYLIARQMGHLARKKIQVEVLGLMDTCFNGRRGGSLLNRYLKRSGTIVFGMWVPPERWSLNRHIDRFRQTLGLCRPAACDRKRFKACWKNSRGWRLFRAIDDVLAKEAEEGRYDGQARTAHGYLPVWFVKEAVKLYFRKWDPGS